MNYSLNKLRFYHLEMCIGHFFQYGNPIKRYVEVSATHGLPRLSVKRGSTRPAPAVSQGVFRIHQVCGTRAQQSSYCREALTESSNVTDWQYARTFSRGNRVYSAEVRINTVFPMTFYHSSQIHLN